MESYSQKLIDRLRSIIKGRSLVRGLIVCALALLCVLELQAIFAGIRTTEGRDPLYLEYSHGELVHEREILSPSEIEPWMTFSYLNFVFNLPKEYLADALVIEAPQYPNIQISRYARVHGLESSAFLKQVQDKVAAYVPARF